MAAALCLLLTDESAPEVKSKLGITVGQGSVPRNGADLKATWLKFLGSLGGVGKLGITIILDGGTNQLYSAGPLAIGDVVTGYAFSANIPGLTLATLQDMLGKGYGIPQVGPGEYLLPTQTLIPRVTNLVQGVGTSYPAYVELGVGTFALDSDKFTANMGKLP